ncbi:hypothetical protein LWI29_018005 [Acer saccharum]|uniref:RNase H type-1 domain-containing protein n=1 Tax=Acer saccharum TaxID=4024 RepID=A0AA39VKN1_ACESA|nr:hypothetical protein LWI29_018005 [Acer saccharum]
MLLNVKESCVSKAISRKLTPEIWSPPTGNNLKFNVDGTTRGKPGPTGIVGVLGNSQGRILCLFSAFVGSHDSNADEVMAIHKACVLCASNHLLTGRNIEFASDSLMAVSWINNASVIGNLKLINIIYDIREHLQQFEGWTVIFNSRETNSEADILA